METTRSPRWSRTAHTQRNTELRESFRLFAEGCELRDEFVDAGCASVRTPQGASLIMDNLDEWAAWYLANN